HRVVPGQLPRPGAVAAQVAGLADKDLELVQRQERAAGRLVDLEEKLPVHYPVHRDRGDLAELQRVVHGRVAERVELHGAGVGVITPLHTPILEAEERLELAAVGRDRVRLANDGTIDGRLGARRGQIDGCAGDDTVFE